MFRLFRRGVCELTRERLSLYLDGELAPQEAETIRQHLEQCEACRAELDTLRATVELLHRVPAIPSPRSFALRDIQPAPAPRRAAFVGLRAATALATLLLIVLAVGDWLNAFPSAPAPLLTMEQTPTQTAVAIETATFAATPSPTAAGGGATTTTATLTQTAAGKDVTSLTALIAAPPGPTLTPQFHAESPKLSAGAAVTDTAIATSDSLADMKAATEGESLSGVQPPSRATGEQSTTVQGPAPIIQETASAPPENALPSTEPAGNASPTSEPASGWPLRQLEYGLLGLVVALAALNLIYWRHFRLRGKTL